MGASVAAGGASRCSELEALSRWAADDLRSLNGQIEFLLRRALVAAGRLPSADGDKKKRDEK